MQEIHTAREEVVESLAMLPERRDVLQEEGETFQVNLTVLSDRAVSLRKTIHSLQDNLEKLRDKRADHESRLLVMETSKTYGALLPEIEGIEEEIRKTEGRIVQQLSAEEKAHNEAEAQERKELKCRIEKERKALDEMERELYARHGELEARWAEESRALDGKTLDIFMRLVETCDGVAVARIKNVCEACSACVPEQRVQEVREGEGVLLCENCGRILYWREGEPETRADDREPIENTRAGHLPSS
jgi:predicted  nucleic acid-binding Zn-ribbon protein